MMQDKIHELFDQILNNRIEKAVVDDNDSLSSKDKIDLNNIFYIFRKHGIGTTEAIEILLQIAAVLNKNNE